MIIDYLVWVNQLKLNWNGKWGIVMPEAGMQKICYVHSSYLWRCRIIYCTSLDLKTLLFGKITLYILYIQTIQVHMLLMFILILLGSLFYPHQFYLSLCQSCNPNPKWCMYLLIHVLGLFSLTFSSSFDLAILLLVPKLYRLLFFDLL